MSIPYLRCIVVVFIVLLAMYCNALIALVLGIVSGVELDVSSGQLRRVSRLFYFSTYQRMEDTPVQPYLDPASIGESDWRLVSVAPRNLPEIIPQMKVNIRGKYGGVPSQLTSLEAFWRKEGTDDQEKKKMSNHLRSLWRQSSNDKEAELYIAGLYGDRPHE